MKEVITKSTRARTARAGQSIRPSGRTRRNLLRSVSLAVFASALSVGVGGAHATTVLPNTDGEASVATPGGILDSVFGLGNLQRIDDAIDQVWRNEGTAQVTAIAKWADFSETFGFISGGGFSALLSVPGTSAPASFTSAQSGTLFQFGLDPSGAPLWSSRESDNSDALDHMVTWKVVQGDRDVGSYVIAWEDLPDLGDQDYNDLLLVVSGVTPVPLPAALWLLGAGAVGLFGVARRTYRAS